MSRPEEVFAEGKRQGTLSHAWLIETDGPDRLSLGRRLAAAVLCENGEGCGTCAACRAVLSGNHPDVITVTHAKPDFISVKEIREQLVDDMPVRPYRAEKKIYLVDEAEKMNPQAQNALLKTLEDPPAYGMILLLTANRNAFLPTVLSRCVCLTGEGGTGEDAGPALRETVFGWLRRAEYLPATEMFGAAAAVKDSGGAAAVLELIRRWLRDVLVTAARSEEKLLYPEEMRTYRSWAARLGDRALGRLWESVSAAERRLQVNVNPDLVLESVLLDLKQALGREEGETGPDGR